ncbi:vasotab-TY1 [Condylostylus longicornis]|uniref:vasotab-TY1 n=1 Tax=Condylostylus longicornis TaxID=2530218 RepID=UPI00244E206F|nr:vasotab-TY1 [Condylostylus longicornis]
MDNISVLILFSLCLTAVISQPVENNNNNNGKCDNHCDYSFNPVCATNEKGESRTFNNACILETENCLRKLGFQKTGDGACP